LANPNTDRVLSDREWGQVAERFVASCLPRFGFAISRIRFMVSGSRLGFAVSRIRT
jgi:hypothetical protein